MKTIKMLSVALIVLFAQMSVVAQNAAMHQNHPMAKAAITTTTFKVWGNCDMCKTRIEAAAKRSNFAGSVSIAKKRSSRSS